MLGVRAFHRVFTLRNVIRSNKGDPKSGLPFSLSDDHKIQFKYTGEITETEVDSDDYADHNYDKFPDQKRVISK